MKAILKAYGSLFAGLLIGSGIYSQNAGKTVNTVQPTIMVIPFTKEGEDMRTILEADVNRRVAITKVKEGFDKRNFTTVDFVAKLKQAIDDRQFKSETQSDFKSLMIEQSGADIYVEVEVPPMVVGSTASSGNSARLIMTGYDASTAFSLANVVCESPRFFTNDYGALVERALSKSIVLDDGNSQGASSTCLEEFLNTLQAKFTDIVENGRPVKITFSLSQGTTTDYSTEIKPDGLPLSDVVENWMDKNAYKNNYHLQGSTDKALYFDAVRIPLKDENGRNYNLNKFSLKIYTFLKSKGLNSSKQIKNGTLFITIN